MLFECIRFVLHYSEKRGERVKQSFPIALVRLLVGLALFAAGIACTVTPALGLAPWDSFHMGLTAVTGLSFGQASIAVGIVLLIIVGFMGEPLGIGTILNVWLIGFLLDIIMNAELFPFHPNPVYRVFLFFTGMVMIAVASWLYIGAGLGAGPRDGLMLTVMRLTGLPVSVTRVLIEGTAALAGFLLGGPIGIGTALIFLLLGPILGVWFRWVDFDPNRIDHKTFWLRKKKTAV